MLLRGAGRHLRSDPELKASPAREPQAKRSQGPHRTCPALRRRRPHHPGSPARRSPMIHLGWIGRAALRSCKVPWHVFFKALRLCASQAPRCLYRVRHLVSDVRAPTTGPGYAYRNVGSQHTTLCSTRTQRIRTLLLTSIRPSPLIDRDDGDVRHGSLHQSPCSAHPKP